MGFEWLNGVRMVESKRWTEEVHTYAHDFRVQKVEQRDVKIVGDRRMAVIYEYINMGNNGVIAMNADCE